MSADAFVQGVTLDHSSAEAHADQYETPLPFYISLDRDFLLLPVFGALLNPFASMCRHIRLQYRKDWDHSVDGREALFRAQMAELFSPARFIVPPKGFCLYRSDRTRLTDVDAVIVDKRSGHLALVQLKWHDVYARSPKERESRRRNLLAASRWVDAVDGWVAQRPSAEIAKALGVEGCTSLAPPILLVVARHSARFTAMDMFDERAAWISWPELCRSLSSLSEAEDALPALFEKFQGGIKAMNDQAPVDEAKEESFQFPGLRVDVIHGGVKMHGVPSKDI